MNNSEAREPRCSNNHLSLTNTQRSREGPGLVPAGPVVEDAATQAAAERQFTQTVLVPPIRSLSIRKPPHYPSTSELQRVENDPVLSQREPRQRASATITRTIERLEALLKEAVQLARTNTEYPGSDPRVLPRTSPGIILRAATLPLEPFPQTSDPNGLRVTFSDQQDPGKTKNNQREHTTDGFRACNSVHAQKTPYKASLAPATVTAPSEDFEMKIMRRRSQTDSQFQEQPEPSPPLPIAKPLKGRQDYPRRRSPDTRTSLSRRNYKKRVKDNEPPSILPRTTSVRDMRVEDDDKSTFSTGFPPELKSVEDLVPLSGHASHYAQVFGVNSHQTSIDLSHALIGLTPKINLRKTHHVDIPGHPTDFEVHESCQHAPVARDWPTSRKRFAAIIACLNTACIGIVIGIYSGEVPAIQYVIVDFHHYTILGNVLLYCGLVIPTLFLWPLPLLHGRKIYTVVGLALTLCLQIPQGVAVSQYRSPEVATYRNLLFLSRIFSGFALGFANINLQATLLDVFGASLQSSNPHGEVIDRFDVRRHGGGMGMWLGIWSFCFLGSISLGFMVGAFIVSAFNVSWGFWSTLLMLMIILLINIIAPEVRRSAYRRTVAEIHGEEGDFSRVGRGEVKMHLDGTGPYWWGEEVLAGIRVSCLMVQQPGFFVLSIYTAWVYAQFTLILMLLGALASRYYMLKPIHVGLCIMALTVGAFLAIPFQKASWLSRARYRPPRTDSMSLQKSVVWTSHLSRRTLFTILLPLAALASTLTYRGPPLSVALPCLFSAMVGFLSNLAIAECYGLIMETFDTSDLQPGMTGRPARKSVIARYRGQRTNFSCYPRISAGFAVTQSLAFSFAAAVTFLGGRLERKVGAMMGIGCVAAVLLLLTLLLTLVLFRWRTVKMIPDRKTQTNSTDESKWEAVVLGKPSGTTRRISILEAGRQTRWSEIRRRNRLDAEGLTGS